MKHAVNKANQILFLFFQQLKGSSGKQNRLGKSCSYNHIQSNLLVDAFNSQKTQVAHNLVVAVTTVAKQCCLLPNI